MASFSQAILFVGCKVCEVTEATQEFTELVPIAAHINMASATGRAQPTVWLKR